MVTSYFYYRLIQLLTQLHLGTSINCKYFFNIIFPRKSLMMFNFKSLLIICTVRIKSFSRWNDHTDIFVSSKLILVCADMFFVCLTLFVQITSSECQSWSAWSRWKGGWQRWPATSRQAVRGVVELEEEQEEEVGLGEE